MTTLRDMVGSDAWEHVTEPSTVFCLDNGKQISWPYLHHVSAECACDKLVIVWSTGRIEITGPKCKELHRDFARNKATMIKADGRDILSVVMEAEAAD